MNVDNEKIRSIIVKSVLGTLTEEENLVLQEWLQGNDQNRVLYQKLSSAIELKHKYRAIRGVDVEEAFRRNQHRLYQNDLNRRMKKESAICCSRVVFVRGICLFIDESYGRSSGKRFGCFVGRGKTRRIDFWQMAKK